MNVEELKKKYAMDDEIGKKTYKIYATLKDVGRKNYVASVASPDESSVVKVMNGYPGNWDYAVVHDGDKEVKRYINPNPRLFIHVYKNGSIVNSDRYGGNKKNTGVMLSAMKTMSEKLKNLKWDIMKVETAGGLSFFAYKNPQK